jgi:hypothetical protein
VANEFGRDWHTVNSLLTAYGTALVDDTHECLGTVDAL